MREEDGPERDGPDRGSRSDDEVFAELVASFDAPVDLTLRSWPEAEELSPSPPPPASAAPAAPAAPATGPLSSASPPSGGSGPGAETVLGDGSGPRDWLLPAGAEADDEHFTPPEPPPLPQPEAATKVAWGAMAAGPVLLLILWITGQDVGGWWGMIAGALFVGGFVALVSRLKEDRDEDDDDPQAGAVV